MTDLVETRARYRARCDDARTNHHRVGLVPTMGALHAGHLALVDAVREAGATFVAVTVFVNPLQFSERQDFTRYPRTFPEDLAACRQKSVDIVFAPPEREMFLPRPKLSLSIPALAGPLEGIHRPGHFEGMLLIVAKLFTLTGPCIAAFGQKDYQQLQLIRQLVFDLDVPVTLRPCPTVRDDDGLALSSRNQLLSANERSRARAIPLMLRAARKAFAAGTPLIHIEARAHAQLLGAADQVDYVSVVHPETLTPLHEPSSNAALLCLAARFGNTRLIDNTVLGAEDPSLD